MGRAFAERFAREGMRVVLADVEQAALDKAVAELRRQTYDVVGIRTDVCRLESVEDLAHSALSAYGRIHIVCNNAGAEGYVDEDRPIWEPRDRDWLWAFGVNFWGVVHGARTFIPIMLAQGEEAHLVNIAGSPKHAVVTLTETIVRQLAQRETRVAVSVLCPAAIRSRHRTASPAPPPQVADVVLQAIKDRQLYILTPEAEAQRLTP
jgi:NAD(P)-dependent dehydrogenase (short-subunit alcohol dehydrogenase family)